MAKSKKLLNCDFLNESAFRTKVSNKGKLLYLYVYSNCDDSGFCGNVEDLIDLFNANDYKFHSQGTLDLIEHNYQEALSELLEKGFLYKFVDSYGNAVYLVRHYHMHNKLPENRVTESNYKKYLSFTILKDNVYHWGAKYKALSYTCDTNVMQTLDKCQTSVKPIEEKRIEENRNEVNIKELNEKVVSNPNSCENDDDVPF